MSRTEAPPVPGSPRYAAERQGQHLAGGADLLRLNRDNSSDSLQNSEARRAGRPRGRGDQGGSFTLGEFGSATAPAGTICGDFGDKQENKSEAAEGGGAMAAPIMPMGRRFPRGGLDPLVAPRKVSTSEGRLAGA